jgi:cytoskeletal protein CcmA (bactofilin family)
MDEPSLKDDEENSLEFKEEPTVTNTNNVETKDGAEPSPAVVSSETPESDTTPSPSKEPGSKKNLIPNSITKLTKKLDVYLLVFILVVVIAAVTIYVVTSNKQKNNTANSQELSQSTIDQLNNNDVNVGGSQQTLDIESNSIFSGNVIMKGNLQVAGNVSLGGSLSLVGLNVSGTSDLDQVNASSLADSGAASIGGQLTVKQAITDNGGATFGGDVSAPEITASSILLNGDLQISHHITTNGTIPTAHTGGALGGGGTTSVSGTDTAGTVTVNIGSNPSDGCFTTIDFATSFANSPHVVISPVQTGSNTPPNVSFYVTRSTSSFSICGAISQFAGTSFGIDYIVID